MRHHSHSVPRNWITRLKRSALHCVAALAGLALGLGFAPSARAQTVFGTNSGAFADYLQSYGMQSLPLRSFGTSANPFGPDASVQGPNGSLVNNFGTVTYAQNYPSGTYVIQFDSPSPVTIGTNGFFSQPANVTRNGTHAPMTRSMT